MDKKRIMLNKTDIELDKDKLKKQLQKLVADFTADNGWQKAEEGIQTHFIVKLLELLGWIGSKHIKINETQDVKTGKKPDIILRDSGSKLLVIESKEAKNKNVLDGSYGPKTFVEQLLNYCQAEGLAWGVLTNFVEWRLYNEPQKCLYKEKKYAFHDLLWPEANKNSYIDLLSDEGLDFLYKLSKSDLVTKNGKIDIDPIYYPKQLDLEQEKIKKEFFNKIKNWRAKLKNFIHKNYASYSLEDVDLMAQEILDRMIFMDICHDKGVINENHIQSVLSATKRTYYDELKEKFKIMDEKFNTELFASNECDQIKINNKEMEPIIRELDEINFAKLSVHIIGEVYENYLGELLKSSAQSPDKIKEKQKSKRKSQGIYYTPDYIVDYIVKYTVGELLKNVKTVAEIEKIRVLDPACGSGSFLIRAFDEFYNAYTRVKKDLGFDIKKKILQKNLFGVDLDERAVEITKLNLMIKALEGATVKDLEGKHLLPNLKLNIRCGNSLIGGEKLNKGEGTLDLENYQKEKNELMEFRNKFNAENDNDKKKELLKEIDVKEKFINGKLNKGLGRYFANLKKVNPFNYTVAFCEIFKDGGFDAVIGNPPYVDVRKINTEDKKFLFDCYTTAENRTNTFSIFIESGLNILGKAGLLGFIIPNTILTHSSYKKLREMILNGCNIKDIYNLGSGIFKDAMVETIILIVEKETTISKRDKNKLNVCNYGGNFDIPECFQIKQIVFLED
ncbi:MAG: N-6 DNA methylase [Candidatus Parcubacteria bacterium]|nr:N-6 DNA methylase [Candidatus Parcubacteria bacterium]